MDQQTFERESIKASTMAMADPTTANYWDGYRRGLRRAYFGPRFGTEYEHRLWMKLASEADCSRHERGRGYQAGLRAK